MKKRQRPDVGSASDAARQNAASPAFLVSFIIAQAIQIFRWVYLAMGTILATGLLLIWLHPPQTAFPMTLLALKGIALAVMAGNTLYGSLITWP